MEPGKIQGTVGIKCYLWTTKKQAPGTIGDHEYTLHLINLPQGLCNALKQFWKERKTPSSPQQGNWRKPGELDARKSIECQQEWFKQEKKKQINK